MKKIRSDIRLILLIYIAGVALTGCELGGLDLQEPFEYDYDKGTYSNETKMTAWQFIQSRPDLFSILKEGIEYAGLQTSFEQADCTYLLLADKAFNATGETDMAYFTTHPLPNPNDPVNPIIPETLTLYPVDQVKELLLYHIAKGAWTWSNLPASPTWYNTYATADTARVNLYLLKDRDPNIVFNNFDGHYKLTIKARTTNLKTKEGSYMHVLESWLDRPTKPQLGIY
ncbi:MAG: hypothetical protein AAGU19_14110 [Prolixibacteraceae bacterium]